MLLIGVVVLSIPCTYVAHEASIVRQRRAWLTSHAAMVPSGSSLNSNGSANYMYAPDVPGNPERSPSAIRRWLGDTPVVFLHSTTSELKEASELFPEANLYVGPIMSVEPWPK
jgi:hypothetical protein